MPLRVHTIIPDSKVHGPGSSFVIWTQGCNRHCPGCCNPETWDPSGGDIYSVDDLAKAVVRAVAERGVKNLVFSGGEPLLQKWELLYLIHSVVLARTDLTFVLYTGHSSQELQQLLTPFDYGLFDIVVAGPYERDKPGRHPWLASANQELLFPSGRMSLSDIEDVPDAEIFVVGNSITQTGHEVVLGLEPGTEAG
jgi:anaerobic ribonucleoside-triphosphate reductase activating protein